MPEYVRRLRSAGRNDTRGRRRVCRAQSRIGWGIWGVWQAAVCLGMAFPGVPVGAVRRTYGEWSGGCGGMRSIPIMARRVAAFESLCGMVREKDNAACRGRVLPDRMCGDALRRGGAARQGSQPMRLSPRCASRQAVRPA